MFQYLIPKTFQRNLQRYCATATSSSSSSTTLTTVCRIPFRRFTTPAPSPPPAAQQPPPHNPTGPKQQWKGAFASQHKPAPNQAVSLEDREAYRMIKSKKEELAQEQKVGDRWDDMTRVIEARQAKIKQNLNAQYHVDVVTKAEHNKKQQQQFHNPDHDLMSQDRNVKFPMGFVTIGALVIFCSYTATIFWDFHQDFKEQEAGELKMKAAAAGV